PVPHRGKEENVKFLDRLQPLGLLGLRFGAGAILAGYGYQKVFHGLSQYAGYVHSAGMPAWLGYVSAFTEFLGGIALIAGLLTRLASFGLVINMAVATKVKMGGAHFLASGAGWEFPMLVGLVCLALLFFGAGSISLDWVFFRGGGGERR
ncbi:MAG TPA: DoxX family protein, partial [Terriglobales bacterium]|nr:DoxX family protein [Terriglobales bacterium]